MENAYQNAVSRRERLKAELAEVETFLRLYEKYASGPKREQTEPDVTFRSPDGRQHLVEVKVRKPRPAELVSIIERVLAEAGRPLQRGEIVDALANRDVEIDSQDRPRYIGTILWRNSERFVNVPGEGYTLLETISDEQREKVLKALETAKAGDMTDTVRSELETVVEEVNAQLNREQKESAIFEWVGTRSLPKPLSAELLTRGGGALGRELEQHERSFLRERLVRHMNLSMSASD